MWETRSWFLCGELDATEHGGAKRWNRSCHYFTSGGQARLDYSDPSDRCTNNTTEYAVHLLGLRKVQALGASNFLVICDVDHVKKESEVKESELIKNLTEVR
jgi:ribonuclease HI